MTKNELEQKTEQYKADRKEFYRNLKWIFWILLIYTALKYIEQL